MDNTGRRILVVEDNALLAKAMVGILGTLGYVVVGPAASADAARELMARERIDVALLDLSIQGGDSFDIAADLSDRGCPFAFATGNPDPDLPERWRGSPVLVKPLFRADLQRAVQDLLDGTGTT